MPADSHHLSNSTASPPRICFVSLQARGAFFPGAGAKFGGAETQLRLWAEYLARAGYDVHVLVEDSGQPVKESANGVTLHKVAQPPAGLKRKLVSVKNLALLAVEINADVYLQRSAGIETALTAWVARRVGGGFIYMLASDSELAPPFLRGGGLTPRCFRWGLRRADAITTQHVEQTEAVERLFGREAVEIPNIYSFPPVPPGNMANPRSGALWVGRARKLKGPQHFLELAKRLPQFTFTLVALPTETDPDFSRELEREARTLPNVEYFPGLSPAELTPLYARRGVLINTSDYEGMPNTFLEAAGHGLALASLRADPGGMFAHGRAGLTAGGDLDKLMHLVRGLLVDETGRARWAERGREFLLERHDLQHVGPGFLELITAVIKRAGKKP